MRHLAAIAALGCGCNQIYGLDPTRVRDAAPDARGGGIRISLFLGRTTPSAAEDTPVLAPVPNPAVEVGLVDEPLAAIDYVPDDTGGVVTYPSDFVGKRWRLAYTPPFDIVHELQWSPADGAGHVIAPVVGRLERTVPPPNTGYSLSMKKPGNVLHNFSPATVIYTTGYWSATPSPFTTLTPQVDFASTSSQPTSGPRAAPDEAARDVVLAIDYAVQANGCEAAIVSGGAVAPPIEAGMMKSVELLFFSETDVIDREFVGETFDAAASRLNIALGTRAEDASGSRQIFSRIAHTLMPGFTSTFDGVPAPPLIPLARCPILITSPISANNAGGNIAFQRAMFYAATNDRMISGVRLRSSIASIGLRVGATNTYRAALDVPLPTQIKIGAVGLEGVMDGITIDAAPADLTFALQTGGALLADYYEATLYKIENATLVPIRTYVGIDVSSSQQALRFDPALMTAGADYVLAIRTYRGNKDARNGDFRNIEAPQAVSTMFTRTFKR